MLNFENKNHPPEKEHHLKQTAIFGVQECEKSRVY